jgi:hypothetical protein
MHIHHTQVHIYHMFIDMYHLNDTDMSLIQGIENA